MKPSRVLCLLILLLPLGSCGDSGQPGPQPQPESWPEHIYFKGNTASLNSRYYALVRDVDIWIRPNAERTGVEGPWQKLEGLHEELAGHVTEIAMDDEHILALNESRQIFTMWNALDEPADFRWQKEWGFPFWAGPGMQLRSDIRKWDFSVVSQREDGFYTDPVGNLFPVGSAKCSHIIMFNPGGQTITFNDPWLPRDSSYEIGTPFRSRFISAGLSSSGSTHFLINRYGDMFTRVFDFDLSGLDNLFVRYSYEDQRSLPRPVIQIPAEPWRQQPKIVTSGQAVITDRITIIKTGQNCVHRILRVEGTDAEGRTGFYEKDLPETESSAWIFHPTGLKLEGHVLDNKPYDSSGETLGASEDLCYSFKGEAAFQAQIPDFNCYNSPAQLRIDLADGNRIELALHYLDTVRIVERERGIDDKPRGLTGAIEVSQDLLERLPALPQSVQDFVHAFLEVDDGGRFTQVTLRVTSEWLMLRGRNVAWAFDRCP